MSKLHRQHDANFWSVAIIVCPHCFERQMISLNSPAMAEAECQACDMPLWCRESFTMHALRDMEVKEAYWSDVQSSKRKRLYA